MFPHNSSSHEISTETNAFVQNSKGDVVVLEESSLSGAREGERPEHARYCDIEFINSSMMAAPTSHPKATAANDFLTVLPRQSGELSFADGGEACQSVAPETIKNPTNHLLTYDNNDKIINHDNAEHNHHKYRKQNTPGSLGKLGSSADNSKSTCKLLSDNKDSFSVVSIRVLMLSVRLNDTIGVDCCTAGVPSLVRIPKSDCPQRHLFHANLVDNYSLLGSRLYHGENNNVKANISLISNDSYNNNYNYNINNSKSVILLSSTSYGDYYYLNVTGDGFVGINAVGIPVILVDNNTASDCSRLNRMQLIGKICSVVTSKIIGETYAIGLLDNKIAAMSSLQQQQQQQQQLNYQFYYDSNNYKSALLSRAHKFTAINNASSSITLIVSKNEFTDHVIDNLQFFIDDNLTQVRALSPITSQYYYQLLLSHVTVNKLTQRICVPLLIKSKGYDKNNNNVANNSDYCNYNINYENGSDVKIFINENQDENYDQYDYTIMMNINGNNNQYVIEDIVNVAVCYKTSCVMTTNFSMLGSQNDGISRTEATIFTVGALSFQDNDKSNKPLNDSFKINKYQVSTKIGLESNYNYKSVSKSTPSVKYSDKSETSHQARLDVSDYEEQVKCVRSPVNIPTLTTCEPTMTLKSQSATVTSQTLTVPVSSRLNIENKSNNSSDSNATIRSKFITTNNKNNNSSNYNKNLINYSNEKTSYNDMNYESNNEQVNENINERENSDARPFTRNWARLIAYVRALIPAYHEAYKNNESKCESQRNELKKALHSLFGDNNKIINDTQYDPIIDYKKRWGIPIILSLAGGGESSLNSGGGTNWGSAQATTPNNNNANPSGWGGTPGNAPPPSSNWGTNNVNRPVTGNPNQNQNQGPPGNQTNTTTVNKANNPNQASNSQTGPPTVQPSNPVQPNQNQGSQWPQGKPNPTVVPGQNPPTPNNNGNNVQQPPVVPCPLPGSNGNNNQVANSPQGSTTGGNSPPSNPNPSTKQQLEQLNTMREALFSQDGWGCQHVNQDTNWDVPASPEPSMNKDGVPMWKPPVNNGTDLWEANLRNGGQPPPPQQAKTPWGHTPSTNIGGTWGEDDDTADSSNMWTGAPTPTQPNTAQWPGAANNQTGSSWGDPRIDPRDPRDIRSVDPREMRDPRDHRMSMDPREHLRPMDPMARDPRMADMRGDPRGISGRLNGASADAMWGQPPGPPHHQMGHQHPSGPPAKMLNPSSMNQWTAPPPKDMMPGKPSGWEEPSPPTQRRNVPNYDDGTSLWGNPAANQRTMPTNKVSHWKDLPTPNLGRGGMQCPPGMPQNRMPGQPMKPDVGGPMWGHPGGPSGRNGSWGEGPHDTSNWDEPKTPASWNEQPLNPASWGGPTGHKPKAMGPTASWGETDMEQGPSWGHPAKTVLTKEVIWNSREFRYLCDLGYKKEDVETALRNREMNRDEAQELLSQLRSLDWRRHETPSGYDPTNQSSMSGAYPKFSHVAQQMSFPPGECLAARPSGAGTGSVSGSVASASLLKLQQQQQQQAAVQLQPPQQPNANPPQPPFNQASRTPQNPPSTQQLRMLVQQIQLAVQEGYLNQQILNQPLAPPTLILLNQLLQQIKVLQQLHQQHSVQSSLKGNSQTVLQISVQITKTKQQIANLQNQIAVQQATYMKQQAQQQQQHPAAPSQSSDYYNKSSLHDPMSAIQNSFSDLTMNKEPPVSQQQSRLNQWKLPSLDKDGDITGNEFSRAPGSSSKPPQTPVGLSHTHSSPNMNPLLGQGDGTWSTRLGESGWPDAGNNDATDGKDWQPGSAAFSDLVPEFEPGKPWKGTQMKNIEDDPSITPGSVVRSLSLAAIKDPDTIFSSSTKTSPPPQSQNVDTSIPSLSNSTWSFNPPATTPSAFSSSKNTWTDSAPPPTAVTSELWGAPMNKARQGPPPGLSSKGVGGNTSNGWALGGVSRSSSSWALQSGGGGGGGGSNAGWLVAGTWLLLKNLTPQIDGSTLKTLCMQHGPVQDFRLYLNHGIALTKYSSRDEASKAQGALNNCVLGNTTIFAESPADSEVHTLLQQLSHGGQQQTGTSGGSGWGLRPSNKAGPPPDTWGGSSNQLWGAPPSTNSLWSNSGIDSSDAQRTTPSSLSYLPGDLLGGESM